MLLPNVKQVASYTARQIHILINVYCFEQPQLYTANLAEFSLGIRTHIRLVPSWPASSSAYITM